MNRIVRFILMAGILVFAVGARLIFSGRSRNRSALAKYKAELRAKGEQLTWAELGYPRQAETNNSLNQLLAAVAKIHKAKIEPG